MHVLSSITLISALSYLEMVLCLSALTALLVRKQLKDFGALSCFLAVRVTADVLLTALHSGIVRQRLGDNRAYDIYFFTYWVSFALEAILALLVVYGIFRLA